MCDYVGKSLLPEHEHERIMQFLLSAKMLAPSSDGGGECVGTPTSCPPATFDKVINARQSHFCSKKPV